MKIRQPMCLRHPVLSLEPYAHSKEPTLTETEVRDNK